MSTSSNYVRRLIEDRNQEGDSRAQQQDAQVRLRSTRPTYDRMATDAASSYDILKPASRRARAFFARKTRRPADHGQVV